MTFLSEPGPDCQRTVSSFHNGNSSNRGVQELPQAVKPHNLHNPLPVSHFTSPPTDVSETTFRDLAAASVPQLKIAVDGWLSQGQWMGIKAAAPLLACVIRWLFFCPDAAFCQKEGGG